MADNKPKATGKDPRFPADRTLYLRMDNVRTSLRVAFHGWGKYAGWWSKSPITKYHIRRRMATTGIRLTRLVPTKFEFWGAAARGLAQNLKGGRERNAGHNRAIVAKALNKGIAEVPRHIRRVLNSPFTPDKFRSVLGLNIIWALDYIPKDAFEWWVLHRALFPVGQAGEREWVLRPTKKRRREILAHLERPRVHVAMDPPLCPGGGIHNRLVCETPESARIWVKWMSRRHRWHSGSYTPIPLVQSLERWTRLMGTRPEPRDLRKFDRVIHMLRPQARWNEAGQAVGQLVYRMLRVGHAPNDYIRAWTELEDLIGVLRQTDPVMLRRIRTWDQVHEAHEEAWQGHNERFRALDLGESLHPELQRPDETLAPYRPLVPGITQLVTGEDFDQEGTNMHHCIGAYYPDSRAGRSTFYHLELNGERASLQLTPQGDIWQFWGPCNQTVSQAMRTFCQEWMAQPATYSPELTLASLQQPALEVAV